MNQPKVTVLMSTYNGETYVCEQIDSILRQKNVVVQLQIRDDGSKDNTVSICRKYAEENENISFVEGTNLGVGKSFLELLSCAQMADYYAFADQDDIWLEDKLERAVSVISKVEKGDIPDEARRGHPLFAEEFEKELQKENATRPVLYGANQILVDKDGKGNQKRFVTEPLIDFFSSITNNKVYGCTMVMNDTLRVMCCKGQRPDDLVLKRKNHDAWILYVAYCVGVFVFDFESKMLYRQHEAQVVGVKQVSGIKKLLDKAKRLFGQKNKGLRSQIARNLLESFSEQMDLELRKHLEILGKANSLSGVRELVGDDVIMQSFNESRVKIFVRGLLKWI